MDSTDQQNTYLELGPIWILSLIDISLHCLKGSICSVHLEHAGSLGHQGKTGSAASTWHGWCCPEGAAGACSPLLPSPLRITALTVLLLFILLFSGWKSLNIQYEVQQGGMRSFVSLNSKPLLWGQTILLGWAFEQGGTNIKCLHAPGESSHHRATSQKEAFSAPHLIKKEKKKKKITLGVDASFSENVQACCKIKS